MKVDQCQHCTVRGDFDACKVTPCNQHESWYAVTMQAKIADLEAAEEGAKIAFGDVVDQKHALTKRCKSLEASIAAMRDIISTQAARIAALEADAARYRLVRRGQHWSVVDGVGNTLRGDDLDTAIDAAMQTKP